MRLIAVIPDIAAYLSEAAVEPSQAAFGPTRDGNEVAWKAAVPYGCIGEPLSLRRPTSARIDDGSGLPL